MEHFHLKTWEQIQHDNKTYYDSIVIYKNGNSYYAFNESAMKITYCFQEHPFILELISITSFEDLIKLTFTPDAFEYIKTNYKVISLPADKWLAHTQHFVSGIKYQMWSNVMSLELGSLHKKKNIVREVNKTTGLHIAPENNSYLTT